MSQVVINFNGEVSSLGITRLTREKLYGKKRRVIVDDDGQECVTAQLTRDGAALLPSGTTAYLYVNDDDDVIERRSLQAVDADGTPVERIPSTLGEEQEAQEVTPDRILEHITTAVYEIDPDEIGDTLAARLKDGAVFEFRFNYRAGFDDWPAFLLQNGVGIFCLVCQEAPFDMLRREEEIPEDDKEEEDPFADDLDFGMF